METRRTTVLNDIQEMSRQMLEAGEEWADLHAAATALEEARKSLRSQLAVEHIQNGTAASKAVEYAQGSQEYADHLIEMTEARRKSNRARVKYDTLKAFIELWRSKESTRRAEMQLV